MKHNIDDPLIDMMQDVPVDLFIEHVLTRDASDAPEANTHEYDLVCRTCGSTHVIKNNLLAERIDDDFGDGPNAKHLVCGRCGDHAWNWVRGKGRKPWAPSEPLTAAEYDRIFGQ